MSDDKPTIDVSENGPYVVKNLGMLTGADDEPIDMAKAVIALCRCGQSSNKPFCDGTHRKVGFSGQRERQADDGANVYEGKELTIVDHHGACCHAGECTSGAPEVFFRWEGDARVSVPDAAQRQAIIDTIRRCPSGSLAYRLAGELHDEYFSEPEIFVSKDGPLHVRGGIELSDDAGSTPVSKDHYTLCRCGASKNKPFCDGTHTDIGFKG